jgi:DNA invertase Pin-like site-specific DNA recombinase
MNGRFVAYYRVSTSRQGLHGLGMDAQREAVTNYLNGGRWQLVAEFAEVESGKRNARPELQRALTACKHEKATLLIAKLDRLSRNAAFLLNLQESGVPFVCVDMPQADRFMIGIMALVAQKERELTSERTKAGLAAAKRRGIRLGTPDPAKALKAAYKAKQEQSKAFVESLAPVIKQIQKAGGTSLRQIASALNTRGFKSQTGREFKAQTVANLLAQIGS